MCVVRFHTIFSSFKVSLSITPLQLSTNWLLSVSFTALTTPAVDKIFLEFQSINQNFTKKTKTHLPSMTA